MRDGKAASEFIADLRFLDEQEIVALSWGDDLRAAIEAAGWWRSYGSPRWVNPAWTPARPAEGAEEQRAPETVVSNKLTWGEQPFVRSTESYRCPFCMRESHNPNDIRQRFCGACTLFAADVIAELEARIPDSNRKRRVELPAYLVRVLLRTVHSADRLGNEVAAAADKPAS